MLCEKCQREMTPSRWAVVRVPKGVSDDYYLGKVRDYLPTNYTARAMGGEIWIEGVDDHGWTLDGYVIPRLASGLIAAFERPIDA